MPQNVKKSLHFHKKMELFQTTYVLQFDLSMPLKVQKDQYKGATCRLPKTTHNLS